MVPELSPALTSYLPPFHHYQAPESPDSTFPETPGPNHTCWCCWRGTGPLASCCPWLDSLCSRLSSRSGPTLPPSVSRSSAEGICRSRGFSLGLADLWGWGEMSTEETCCGTGHVVGSGGWGQIVLHPAGTLVITQPWAPHIPPLALFLLSLPSLSPNSGAQFSRPSLPPLPRSPHLDQLDVRFEPLQAGLQGAQQ